MKPAPQMMQNPKSAPQSVGNDPVAAQVDFLKLVLPEAAIHIVNIRRRQNPINKTDMWVVSPGLFHVQRGDLIYWSVAGNSAIVDFTGSEEFIGAETLALPYNGTRSGIVGPNTHSGMPPYLYRVHMSVGPDAESDDGGMPTIIVDD